MPEKELFVADPNIPFAFGLRCLFVAHRVFHRAKVTACQCAAGYFTRDQISEDFIAYCPVDPAEASEEDFDAFMREHYPDVDMAEVNRLARTWEEATTAAAKVIEEVMPGYEPQSWIVGLRPRAN